MSQNEKQKALLICSPFFGYFRHIISQLEREGFEVDYYNDRPSEHAFIKGLIKVYPKLLTPMIRHYYENITEVTSSKEYDLVFVINNKVMTKTMIHKLKSRQSKAKFVFYTWDSIQLYPQALDIIRLFDSAYSFDLKDCEVYTELKHLPLFYTEVYAKVGEAVAHSPYALRHYDIVSVCTAHPNRYRILSSLLPKLKEAGLVIYSFMFIEPLQYYYNKFFVKEFKNAKLSEFNTTKLNESEVVSLFENAKAILDIQHASQTGLTMRTLETLGSKRKLITFNPSIKNYDFYNEDNIYVLDDNNWQGIQAFLEKDFEEIDEAIYKKYSLHSWIKEIIGICE